MCIKFICENSKVYARFLEGHKISQRLYEHYVLKVRRESIIIY